MLGWVRRAALTASSWKRARKLGSAASSGCSTLTTTSRPRTRSCPRQTLVMPPVATCWLSSYRSASRRGRPEPTCDMLIYEVRGVGPRGSRPSKSNKKRPLRPLEASGRARRRPPALRGPASGPPAADDVQQQGELLDPEQAGHGQVGAGADDHPGDHGDQVAAQPGG